MTSASDWSRQKKALLGLSLILAPLLIGTADVMISGIYDGDDKQRYLADIADNKALYYAAGVIGAVGALFLVGAVIALIHLVRVRHPKFALAAGGLALVGAITMSGVWLVFTIIEVEMAEAGNLAVFAGLIDRVEDSGRLAPLFVTWIGTALGMFLLGVGLVWSRTVPRWMGATVAVAFLVVFVAEDAVTVVGDVVLLAALGSIGLAILRSPLEDWEAGDLAHHVEPPAAPTSPPPAVATP